MAQIAIDRGTGALLLTEGALSLVEGEEEIAQWTAVRLRLIKGECFLNLNLGLDQLGVILKKGALLKDVHGALIANIEGTPGVIGVTSISSTLDSDRSFTVEFGATISLDDLGRRGPLHDRIEVNF